MGITTVLQGEDGAQLGAVEDPTNVLHRILPAHDDESYHYINQIDWYGDTVFNYLQAQRFLAEWCTLESQATAEEARRVFDGIRSLAERMASERLTYLKFIGD
jgi:hypothetical protein